MVLTQIKFQSHLASNRAQFSVQFVFLHEQVKSVESLFADDTIMYLAIGSSTERETLYKST